MPTSSQGQRWASSLPASITSQVITFFHFVPLTFSPDSVFLSAAEALSDMVTEADLSVGRLYPPLDNIREISVKIASQVATEAYQQSTASTYPEPEVRGPTYLNSY